VASHNSRKSALAKVKPFEAIRYNTPRFGKDVTRFVSPPYDVVSPSMERALKEDRLNISYITLGNQDDGYCVAARRLKTWLDDKVLVKDQGKSFYMYEQTFAGIDGLPRVRSGIVGLVKLEELSKGTVLAHEKTIPRHKEDRMALIQAVRGNIEQIFLLYDDASGEIEDILRTSKVRDEELRFIDAESVQHRIIRISDAYLVEKISKLFDPAKLLIADGHHRYETALEFRDLMRRKEGQGDEERPYDYIMATLVGFRNPGLVVYPTHRLVSGVDQALIQSLPRKLEEEFELKQFDRPETLAQAVEDSKREAFGVWIPGSGTLMLATRKKHGPSQKSIEDLPVYIVQERVLKRFLGYTAEMLDKKVNIEYVKGTDASKTEMATGEHQACFFVKPPSLEQVMAIAQTTEKMPHKSTYFFPKMWSGTLMHLF
jgi:uncharacterized protein (DUF1015 family)